MSNFNYLFFDFYQENIEFSKVNENNFNNYYCEYIYKKIGVNQNNEIDSSEEEEEEECLTQNDIEKLRNIDSPCNDEYTFSELMYSINDQFENYKDLFFFPFSLILRNLEENFDEKLFKYLKKFLESKEKKLYTLLEKLMSKIELKKYSKKEEQFFGNKASELEEEFKNIFGKYLKGIFIKLTLDTLACKQYRDKIEQLKVLYSYMSKKNWFKFCTLEIKSFLKNYYTNDNSNFDFENIDRFIYFLENNSKDDSDMLYNDISRTQFVDKFGFDFNLDLDFIIEEYVEFFNISLIMLDKDVDLENNRNTKTINKKINFLNCIFEYYFNEKEIVKANKLSEREINVLTNKNLLNSVESYQSTFKEILKNSFSKESLEVLKYSELPEDNFHIHISKLLLNYSTLFCDVKIEINKLLLRIINLIRKNLDRNPYKSRQLENNKYLEVFKIEILNLNRLSIGTKHSVYKNLLKINEILGVNNTLLKIFYLDIKYCKKRTRYLSFFINLSLIFLEEEFE